MWFLKFLQIYFETFNVNFFHISHDFDATVYDVLFLFVTDIQNCTVFLHFNLTLSGYQHASISSSKLFSYCSQDLYSHHLTDCDKNHSFLFHRFITCFMRGLMPVVIGDFIPLEPTLERTLSNLNYLSIRNFYTVLSTKYSTE